MPTNTTTLLASMEQVIKDDINDLLALSGWNYSVQVVSVSPRPRCECEFCTHPDHQQAEYSVHVGIEGSKTMFSMRILLASVFRSFELRQVWVEGCVARLQRERNHGY